MTHSQTMVGCLIDGGRMTVEEGNKLLIDIGKQQGYELPAPEAEIFADDEYASEVAAEVIDFLGEKYPFLDFSWVEGDLLVRERPS